ncbi:MAG: hypothetical protein RL026_1665 [Pseudomonadota bacterium]
MKKPILNAGRALLLAGLALASAALRAQQAVLPPDPTLKAMNVQRLEPRLVLAGQPDAASLATLRERDGIEAVIYLAPSSSRDAVAEEPALLARQGIEFVHIPIPWEKPEPQHLQAFRAAMNRLKDRKVLVHCQGNYRASALTYVWRVLDAGVDPAVAKRDLQAMWTPAGPWKTLVDDALAGR